MQDNGEQAAAQRRVLVIDDDPATRDLLTSVLLDEGYAVDAVPTATTALARIAGLRPDAILLDLWLPGMDGPTFAARYREMPGPHAPLLVLSGGTPTEVTEISAAIGAAGCLCKPFDLEDLLVHVERLAQAEPEPPPPRAEPHDRAYGAWQGRLAELAGEVARLRTAVDGARATAHVLLDRERMGTLSPDEAQRLVVLRREWKQLSDRLAQCSQQYAQLQGQRLPPS